jgi:hypothetical protein
MSWPTIESLIRIGLSLVGQTSRGFSQDGQALSEGMLISQRFY